MYPHTKERMVIMSDIINIKDEYIKLPALTMRGLVIYPEMILHFDVAREKSILALKAATENDRKIFLVAQKDPLITDPTEKDVFKVGVVAEVRQIISTPDSTTRVLVEGLYRAKLHTFTMTEPYYEMEVLPMHVPQKAISQTNNQALLRMLKDVFKEYSTLAPKMPKELYKSILSESDLAKLFDLVVFNVMLRVEDKQRLLEISTLSKRVTELISILMTEIKILQTEYDIHEQVRENIERNQREYYLREQMKVISRQLGEQDTPQQEAYDYIDKIEEIGFDEEIEEKLLKDAEKLLKMPSSSQEAAVIRTYLDNVLDIPWNYYTKDKTDIERTQKQLDRDHYGLKKVKERITEIIAVRELSPNIKGQIICLAGPPGVGKTSIGKSIAHSMGRKYARISLGGVRDEADIRGHRKTYIGAMPGRIANAIKQAGSMNPVILLDEIDKMGNDFRGDPSSAMLEVLDSEQNSSFRDHYLEIPIDLSKVLFITTANNIYNIPAPLLDRMEVIELSSYTREEKFNIAKKHLVPKQLKKHGEKASIVRISNEAIYAIIDFYTREAGVRKLERNISALCRKAAKIIVSGESEKVSITGKNIEKFLGVKKYLPELISKRDEIGTVNGLAWTSVGGTIMPLEVLVLDGTGKIEVTGSLGDVMKESAKIAISLTRSLAKKYSINPNFYKEKDIHIHAPEGAVPKDGPSAGVTLTTALVSALSGMPVKRDIAMTGEITLRGKVLAIGGLREKTMAAYKSGVKTVIIPKENEADLSEIDEIVKNSLNFVVAEDIKTVLDTALIKPIKVKPDAIPNKPPQKEPEKPNIIIDDKHVKQQVTVVN